MRFDANIVQTRHESPLGPMILAATDTGLAGAWFDDQRHLPDNVRNWPAAPDHPLLRQAGARLDDYFTGRRHGVDLQLDLRGGTAFQQAVWTALRAIPRGQTLTYGTLARRIGKPAAVRAVGAAVGRNPLSVFVPCHRVLGQGGALAGYAGGLARKQALLRLEGVPV